MAGVLDALASYVTNMLTEMAKEEVAMLIGVSSGIEDLGVKLGDLKNFLADADRRNITDQAVQVWVNELKRAMYDATDILDLCQLKFMERSPSADRGCLNPLLFCMRNPLHAHEIGSRIKGLNKKLDGIYTRGRSFNFIKLEAYQDRKTVRPPPTSRKTDPLCERLGAVGEKIEEDTRVLMGMLTKEVADKSPLVVAIVGVGGIGKTTLGKKVFNDPAIQSKFANKIWLSITRDFSEAELLRTAITFANGDLPGPAGGAQDKALLVPALANAIRDKKFFLVLDDMWGTNEWSNLLKAPFSHGAPGSRVLVTTRDDTVARGMKAMHPYHRVDKLGSEDAWLLLQKQVVINEESEREIDMLKDIGLKIISHCDGLPLAIKVMGGLLCQREKERRDWENVLNDVIRSVSEMPEELNYAIYLSYEDLPSCLKQCFLHFSLKPKRTKLEISQIVGMWIAEGFVHGNSNMPEELGNKYYKELISRNLVEPDTDYRSLFVGNMHDVVRSFARFVARDEALVIHNGEIDSKLGSGSFLRLSIETEGVGSGEFEWRFLKEQKSLRTLTLTGNCKIQSNDSLISFSSLRSLCIESTHLGALVESLYQLKHLRYLAVKCTDKIELPKNIDKMKFLRYLILDGCESLVQLPDSIIKLRALRYLDIDNTRVNRMPRGFSALANLRELFGFRAHMDGDWCSLEELGPLSQLKCLGLEGLENVSASQFAVNAQLGAKVYLTYLDLCCSSRLGDDGFVKGGVSEEEKRRIEEVYDELHPYPCLEDLFIRGYFGRQFPRWIMSTATTPLKCLTTVVMVDLACCTQLPDGLCHLPNLGFLRVDRAPAIKRVGPEFVGAYNQCQHPSSQAAAAFPRLHRMRLIGMVEWEEWEWEEEVRAMPILEELTLDSCKLGRIPRGLASHARALKKLTIWDVGRLHSLENFVSVVELDLYDMPDLVRISNFPKLRKLQIQYCPKLESLQKMTALRRLVLTLYYDEERLPLYLQTVTPSHLLLDCGPEVLASMAAGKSGLEWDKFSHIKQVEAFADGKKWHVLYTSEPYNMETNIEPNLQDESEDEAEDQSEDEAKADRGEMLAGVQLSEKLMSNTISKKLGEHEIAWVDSEVGEVDEKLTLLPPSSTPSAHKSVLVGDLKLADLRQFLANKDLQVEFAGGALRCSEYITARKIGDSNQKIILRCKGSRGSQQIVIDGPLCEDYKIRELLYSQFLLL